MIVYKRFKIHNIQRFVESAITNLQHFEQVMVLNSNSQLYETTNYDFLIAAGSTDQIEIKDDEKENFSKLQDFYNAKPDWIFGHISYDMKNNIEKISTQHPNDIGFSKLFFFRPKILLISNKNQVEIHLHDNFSPQDQTFAENLEVEQKINSEETQTFESFKITITNRISKERYFAGYKKIQHHIQQGNIYEANYCQEFFAKTMIQNPDKVYIKLNTISPAPFSAYYRNEDRFLMCASPERYLTKKGNKIISQPIKGTTRRGLTVDEDRQRKESLINSSKEKAENVMIVDLVRNDLSRTAERGSVSVDELFGIYSFPQVHQMISTVSSRLKEGFSIFDVLKTTFPMGSMTGAPKISAMKIIDETEAMARGLYSGTVGYISPEGNADFNVIIRSIQYNQSRNLLSFITGGAITIQSNAEDEYEECFVKANGLFKALE